MDIGDFKKIRTQEDLRNYLNELNHAIQAIFDNDGVFFASALYCSLRICIDSLFYAKMTCGDFDEKLNSFKDE